MEENKKEKEEIIDTEEVYVYKINLGPVTGDPDLDDYVVLESKKLFTKDDFKELVKKYRYKDKKKKERRSPSKIVKMLIKNEGFDKYKETYTDVFKIK